MNLNKLVVDNLCHTYVDGDKKARVLKGVNAEFESGKMYAIMGESGSGKTTLISLIAALDNIMEGDIIYNGESLKKIGNQKFRLNYVNIVFQSYNLIKYMTAKENVEVAIDFAKVKVDPYKLLESVGITKEDAERTVLKLSGGEQQRVAIARSMVGDEPIIVADEPTGNLDEETEEKIMNLFSELAKQNRIVIIVTHSKNVAKYADVVYRMKKGVLN